MEDRLNPVPPAGADEGTLSGYAAIHGRAAAFEGGDGLPYTVAIEGEAAEDADGVWVAYLVFVRWAADSTAIMGHVESGDLVRAESEQSARDELGRMRLSDAKDLLDRLLAERQDWATD